MPALKVGVRGFCEQITRFLESDTPIAVTLRGETLGIYVPAPRKAAVRTAASAELRAAADRLAQALSDVNQDELLTEFEVAKRGGHHPAR